MASQKLSNVFPTPKGEKERGAAARRATLFLSLFCRRRRQALAEEYDF